VKLSEFVPSPGSKVHVPPTSAPPAGYLDGIEQQLLDALRGTRDRSVGSPELAQLVRDWPTLYHLTPYRSTIFDCLGFARAAQASVLELGAGCGAITRWLGEHFGTVHAIEGSLERAAVAQARVDDLDNVTLFSANYSHLDEREAYDVATLIGVLEYGHLYHPSTSEPRAAALDNLRIAHRALRQDGLLVIAIENRLGLKYFSGAREDHSGRRYESIHGYPQTDHGVAFSARVLEAMVREAGFDAVEVLVPFPDYKLATTIVDPAAGDALHLHNWLQGTAPDRGGERRTPAFSETLATRELAAAGLLKDLANSFLVLAYRGDRGATQARLGVERGWAARHYALDRRPVLRKRVTLPAEGGRVVVEPVLAQEREAAAIEIGPFSHVLADEPFAAGDLALVPVLRTLTAHGLGPQFFTLIHEHAAWLQAEHGTGRTDADGVALIDGAALDCVWGNLVSDERTGGWTPIDREWRFRGALPLDYLLWRNVNLLHHRYRDDLPVEWGQAEPDSSAWAILVAAGLAADAPARLALAQQLEATLQAASAPGPLPATPPEVQALTDEAGGDRLVVLARAEEIIAAPELLRDYADAFGAEDPLTLVLDPAGAQPDLVGRLRAAIAQAGLDEERLPDTLVGEPGAWPQAAALLTATGWGPAGVPRFAAGELAGLRTLADRWQRERAAA
jgi:hypothetical protein